MERYEVLIEQLSRREDVSEKLKEENQMEWVRRMNNLENRAAEGLLRLLPEADEISCTQEAWPLV